MTRQGRCKVIAPHTATYPDPIRVHKGEQVTLGKRDDEYPGWVWCTAKSGKNGWVPEEYLAIEGGMGTMRRDYDATELTVAAGETVELLAFLSGWGWCRKADGTEGWLPLSVLSESGHR